MTSGTAAPVQTPMLKIKKSRKRFALMNPWRRILLEDSMLPFAWHIGTIGQISAHITLHELLHLSKKMREVLRDALADSESFLTQMPIRTKEEGVSCPQCHLVQHKVPCITFTPEDMLLKDNRHGRPLYYIGYIGSTHIERIQVNPGSTWALSPSDFFIFSASYWAGCQLWLRPYMA